MEKSCYTCKYNPELCPRTFEECAKKNYARWDPNDTILAILYDFKQRLTNYIESRINYFSGGDEMKSMNESIRDEIFVEELKNMKKTIDEIAQVQDKMSNEPESPKADMPVVSTEDFLEVLKMLTSISRAAIKTDTGRDMFDVNSNEKIQKRLTELINKYHCPKL